MENSWGEDRGEKGYLVMCADWFREFGFEVVVDKKYVPEDVMRVFDMTLLYCLPGIPWARWRSKWLSAKWKSFTITTITITTS